MNKTYYQLVLQAVSPLAMSNGKGELTDRDVLLDAAGKPFLPGSAIAGMLRARFDTVDANNLFGYIKHKYAGSPSDEDTTDTRQSAVYTYDARLISSAGAVSVRDAVALDEHKTAKKGAKFDFEVVDAGATFRTFLEVDGDASLLEEMLCRLHTVSMGAKTTRGYGTMKVLSIHQCSFALDSADGCRAWLAFDLFAPDAFAYAQALKRLPEDSTARQLTMHLRARGGLIVRRYTTDAENSKDDLNPDFHALTTTAQDGETILPTIPGTSWAGAFRSHLMRLAQEAAMDVSAVQTMLNGVFGNVTAKGGQRSNVQFSESLVEGFTNHTVVRNAIDRFAGGTRTGALYTEALPYGGTTSLTIQYHAESVGHQNQTIDWDGFAALLAAAICDLHNGWLTVGGETSVGRGMFEIVQLTIDGKPVAVSYADIRAALQSRKEETA